MLSSQSLQKAKELLTSSTKAVALTGAGVSTPSGIPDFRSPGSGLWQRVDPFQVASLYGFRQRPQAFYDWIQPFAKLAINAEPNIAHKSLADLESDGPLEGIITQNIDMLHHKAGSKKILEVHGHWREATCLTCYAIFPSEPYLFPYIEIGEIPHCEKCGGVLKPNIILIGEQLPIAVLTKAKNLILECDLMLVAGSSLEVMPVADLPRYAAKSGARVIIINLEPTYMDPYADAVLHADVVDVLPELAAHVKNQ